MNSSYSKKYHVSFSSRIDSLWNTLKGKTMKDLKGIVLITIIREFYIIGVNLGGPKIRLLINFDWNFFLFAGLFEINTSAALFRV
jgi:hypothetical protein